MKLLLYELVQTDCIALGLLSRLGRIHNRLEHGVYELPVRNAQLAGASLSVVLGIHGA